MENRSSTPIFSPYKFTPLASIASVDPVSARKLGFAVGDMSSKQYGHWWWVYICLSCSAEVTFTCSEPNQQCIFCTFNLSKTQMAASILDKESSELLSQSSSLPEAQAGWPLLASCLSLDRSWRFYWEVHLQHKWCCPSRRHWCTSGKKGWETKASTCCSLDHSTGPGRRNAAMGTWSYLISFLVWSYHWLEIEEHGDRNIDGIFYAQRPVQWGVEGF